MRLADAAALPLDYRDYATQVRDFFDATMKTARRRKLASGFDEKPMTTAIKNFADQAEKLEQDRQAALSELERSGGDVNDRQKRALVRLRLINDALMGAERSLLDERGLRGRSWYRHQIYAPGTYTGYAAQPLPDFQQALDDRNTANAAEGLRRVVEAINRAAETLRKARD